MATSTYEEVELVLLDGTKIKARPLKISLLRPFMKKFGELAEVAEDNDKSTTVLIECVQIAMKQYKPEIADDAKKLEENIGKQQILTTYGFVIYVVRIHLKLSTII